jgi:hypothetical protein
MTGLDAILFTKSGDGFDRNGEVTSKHGIFQWRQDGTWCGCGATEPIEDLLTRMTRSGPYRYEQYRILPAETRELTIKPTCHGCGLPAGISCDLTAGFDDPLVHFNVDRQFSISLPVEDKNGKLKMKAVCFCSVRCADLALLELTRKGPRGAAQGIVHYDHSCQMVGEYRAAQGYKRCPACRTINKTEFCDDVCRLKYEADIAVVLQVAEAISPPTEAEPCRSGKRCLRFGIPIPRQPAPAVEGGEFCSTNCRYSYRARERREILPLPGLTTEISPINAGGPA